MADDSPFADPFTSALEPKRSRRRRRGSGSTTASTVTSSASSSRSSSRSSSTNPWTATHTRAKTEDYGRVSHHPLRRPSLGALSPHAVDADVTRPQLSRMLSAIGAATPPETPRVQPSTLASVDEKVVLVHEVSSKDSLPGVALKYGISLAELRRANQLWSSDSIHLRKTLYIPVDKTKPARTAPLVDTSVPGESPDDTHRDLRRAPPAADGSATIRRIPAAQLSYFPPPSASARSASLPAPRHQRFASSPAPLSASPGTLAALLTAFPARLSFESTTSSAAGSDEQEHELVAVETTPRPKFRDKPHFAPAAPPPPLPISPPPHTPTPDAPPHAHAHAHSPSYAFPHSHHRSTSAALSAPPPDAPRPRPAAVRTVQMEPSPVMALPPLAGGIARRSKSRPRDWEGEGEARAAH